MVMVRLSNESKERKTTMTRTVSFKKGGPNYIIDKYDDEGLKKMIIEEKETSKKRKVGKLKLQTCLNDDSTNEFYPEIHHFSPSDDQQLNAAAIKLQKVYKSYRTRRNLADCAVVVEELWWKALDFAALRRCSISFFEPHRSETAVSRWARARTRAAKVGKGLSKNEKAQKLALRHWLEAIDPRHRYGHNLHLYYNVWFDNGSSQPFFYWLDVGDGKEVNLEKCPRTCMQRQCIIYLRPKEREEYEVIVESGKLVYRQSGVAVDTDDCSKWIFVLSTTRNLYVGQKKKGQFQHSSFLAGGATIAAGRLVARNGVLEAIWPYSGHYQPTEENFMELISFLKDHHVSLTDVKTCAVDDDVPPMKDTTSDQEQNAESIGRHDDVIGSNVEAAPPAPGFQFAKRLSCKSWTSGDGPRIACLRDYPTQLQFQALEHVNLSPRTRTGHYFPGNGPIPSPRPSPKIHLSPRLAFMGLPSPRLHVSTAN